MHTPPTSLKNVPYHPLTPASPTPVSPNAQQAAESYFPVTSASSPKGEPSVYAQTNKSVREQIHASLEEAKYPAEAMTYEREIASALKKEYAGFRETLPEVMSFSKEDDVKKLTCVAASAAEKAAKEIAEARIEIYAELEKEIAQASHKESMPSEEPTSPSKNKSIASLRSLARTIRMKRREGKSGSSDSEALSMHSSHLSDTDNVIAQKKKDALVKFKKKVTEDILPSCKGKIAKAALQHLWDIDSEKQDFLMHPLYQFISENLISEKTKKEFGELVQMLKEHRDRLSRALSLYDDMKVDDQHLLMNFSLYLSDREDSLKKSIEKDDQSMAEFLPHFKETRFPSREKKIFSEAEDCLRGNCQADGKLVRNAVYSFINMIVPEATKAFEHLSKLLQMAEINKAKLETEFDQLDPKEQAKLAGFRAFLLPYYNEMIGSIKVSNQDVGISFVDTKTEVEDFFAPKARIIDKLAEGILKKEYRGKDPAGTVYSFVKQHAPEIAKAYADVAQIARMTQGLRGLVEKAQQDASDPDVREFCRNLAMFYGYLEKEILSSEKNALDTRKNYEEDMLPRTERLVRNYTKTFLEEHFEDTVPEGPLLDIVNQFVPDVAVDIIHKKNRSGPYLFTEDIEEPEAQALQKKLHELFSQGKGWKEYTGPVVFDGKAIATAADFFPVIFNISSSARSWRAPEAKLLFGALEAAFIEVYLAQPQPHSEDAYKQTESYKTKLHNKKTDNKGKELPAEVMAEINTFEKQKFERQLKNFEKYKKEYEDEYKKQPPKIQTSLDTFHKEQIARAKNIFTPVRLPRVRQKITGMR